MSNFYESPLEYEDKIYPTSEHYYQAMKFEDEELQEKVRKASTPSQAAKMGRNKSNPIRRDWEEMKDEVMFKGLVAKFTQNSDLKRRLLATESSELIEHTKRDSYWGDGGDGSGQNMLGKILMRVRDQLKIEKLQEEQ
eukprot:403355104